MNLPIMKFELQEMKHTLMTCFSDYGKSVSVLIGKEIDRMIEAGELEKIIINEFRELVPLVIKESFKSYEVKGAFVKMLVESTRNKGKEALDELIVAVKSVLKVIDKGRPHCVNDLEKALVKYRDTVGGPL